jgi:hypothetical protein
MSTDQAPEAAADTYARKNTIFDDEYSCDVRAFLAGVAWAEGRDKCDMTAAYMVGHAKAKEQK